MDDEKVCALCKGAEDAASNLTQQKLVVNNKCGHRFHLACAEKELERRRTFPCPICQAQVRKTGLTEKTLDELEVARDITVRKRISKIFNRSEEDFEGNLRAYNDYLEEKENLIYDLTNGTKEEAERAQAKIRSYEEEHRGEITKNAAKKVDQERLVEDQLAAARQQQESRKHYNQLEDSRKQQHARKLKLEAQEVALGERDHVTATLGDSLLLDNGEGLEGGGEANGNAPAALPPGMRQMLNIPAPVPQPQKNQVLGGGNGTCRELALFLIHIHREHGRDVFHPIFPTEYGHQTPGRPENLTLVGVHTPATDFSLLRCHAGSYDTEQKKERKSLGAGPYAFFPGFNSGMAAYKVLYIDRPEWEHQGRSILLSNHARSLCFLLM